MHLSMDELIALSVAGKLAELLEGQLGNDFCAHELIIPLREWDMDCHLMYAPHGNGQHLCHQALSVVSSGFLTVAHIKYGVGVIRLG